MGGPRSERAERYFVTDTALDPVEEGEITLNSGNFKAKDGTGVFDLRAGAAGVSDTAPYKVGEATSSTAYVALLAFRFGGSGAWGTPSEMKVVARVEQATRPGDIRIFDVTNGLAIAEVTGLTSLVDAIVDLGIISNIPATEAIFELQAKKVGGGAKKVFVESYDMRIT